MQSLKACLKLFAGVAHLLHGIWTITLHFPNACAAQRSAWIAQWSRGLLRLLGVTLRTQGHAVQQGPMLVVLNHISWLDIVVLLCVQPVSFVSKSEVRRWPLIGWLATQAGTLYIERTRRQDALRMVQRIADALRSGQLIAIFPEGTTSDGQALLPFHANLLQAAIASGSPVQAVALRYRESDGQPSTSPAYVGHDTLLSSVWRLLCAKPVTAQLDFLEPIESSGKQRKELSDLLKQRIEERLGTQPMDMPERA
jgi:1-acyl-sn-glycerol-3-phosphate acyltransferase